MSQSTSSKYFLCTHVQSKLEEAERLFYAISEETEPYKHKYASRKILEDLLKDSRLIINENEMNMSIIITNAIIHYGLGQNYFETEENSSAEKEFNKAIEIFSKIEKTYLVVFSNYLQILYNSLGIIYTNREDYKAGLGLFAKAEHIYELIKKLHSRKPIDIVHTKQGLTTSLNKNLPYPTIFKFFFQGGINLQLAEKNYTLSLFYMAQAYTKCNLKEKAAQYCGITLIRQFETNEYALKDWCANCMSLADYYIGKHQYAQAQYLLLSALQVIPEGTKKKLVARINMSLGRYLLDFLRFSVEKFDLGQANDSKLEELINKKFITFQTLKLDFISLKMPKNIEEINSLFRQMNTQFKKALKVFILDGFVSEYIQISRDLSQGYKFLTLIEKSADRIIAINEKRKELLEFPHREINPKAYENYWQHLTVELAEINNTLFEIRYEQLIREEKPKIKKSWLQTMNKYCLDSIKLYDSLVENLMQQKNMDQKDWVELFNTIITAKFNVAKNYSKIQVDDRIQKVEYLKKSLDTYDWIRKFIKEKVASRGTLTSEMKQTLRSCEEMVDLLPAKIAKVNYGEDF